MQKKLINSQISSWATYRMYLRQMLTLAENVFEFKNIPHFIDVSYMNKLLIQDGSVAFFYDDVLEEMLCLPYVIVGNVDVYGRPVNIKAIGQNGYNKYLKRGEFVIMYDNMGRYPIFLDIIQYATRIGLDTKIADINISQQKTNRVWKTSPEKELSVKRLINEIDGMENTILTYDNLELDETQSVLSIAPYIVDKLDEHKMNDWNEFLRLIGIANMSFFKKERNISDEVNAMQGGTIASRFSRYEPRRKAVEEINELFKDKLEKPIEVSYYDGLPTTLKEREVDENVSMVNIPVDSA